MNGNYRLIGRPGSGSAVCEAVLALSGLPYTIEDLDRWPEGQPPAALTALNPVGQVPVLVLPDGSIMTESAAITLHLADMSPEAGLAPPHGNPLRPHYLRWMLYLTAQTYPTLLRFYYPDRYTTDPDGAGSVREAAVNRMALEWSVFSNALGDGPFILGSNVSAVDLYAAMLISWDEDIQALFSRHPNLQRLYEGVAEIPAVQQVWLRHGM